MKRSILGAALVLALAVAVSEATLVADFDSGVKPNNLGGDFGSWSKDSTDLTHFTRESFDQAHTRTGQGSCLRLDYDVESPHSAFNGFWMKLGTLDATLARSLIIWARSDERKGGAARVKVELKTANESGATYLENITGEWTRFVIPLDEFNIADLSTLSEFVLVFEDHSTQPKEGILYLDDLSIE